MSEKGHPHADLMLLYAQRSKTNVEEWRNWEYEYSDGSWRKTGVMPLWTESTRYRRKPEPKTLYAVINERNECWLQVQNSQVCGSAGVVDNLKSIVYALCIFM